jgi:hypothetical protein
LGLGSEVLMFERELSFSLRSSSTMVEPLSIRYYSVDS